MPLLPKDRLGSYEIVGLLGKGGMGEVYRARDLELERDIAIKVLPDDVANDEERVARFQREARLLASLSHPNIAGIHGLERADGRKALILELVEGPTLAERIERGPVPADEALAIAEQIASALEAGHEAGVIHRDLKPANIKVRADGTVKVLDYGLAKAFEATPADESAELSQSPTLTRQDTQLGMILGTAAYMSPEQAKGKTVDRRTDIFALGAVLYEMVTGQKAFPGEDVSEVLAAVIRLEPDWDAVPADLDPRLFDLMRRCLRKDRHLRLQAVGDARIAIHELLHEPARPRGAESEARGTRREHLWGVAGLVAGALAAGVLLVLVQGSRPTPVASATSTRFSVVLPEPQRFTREGRRMVAFSPDGARFAYTADDRIYLRDMEELEPVPVRGTELDAATPFFSPDGAWLGFFADNAIHKVSVRGGPPIKLCDAGQPFGASWSTDGSIVVGQGPGGILRVSADGGEPEVIASMDASRGEMAYGPQILPDGDTLLFTVTAGGGWDEARIVMQSLASGERQILVEQGADARYLPTGHIVYALSNALFAVPFDAARRRVTGGPVPLLDDLHRSDVTGAAQFSVSENGSLVYVTGSSANRFRLVWTDRTGAETPLPLSPAMYRTPRLSPDGKRLLVRIGGDIWIYDIERDISTRLTFTGDNSWPVWMPDGNRVVFTSSRNGPDNVFWKLTDGSGTAEQLTASGTVMHVDSVARDGRLLFLHEHSASGAEDIWYLPLDGGREARPFLQTSFVERSADLSPDGRWVAYESNESGQPEIYVRPFPGTGAKVQVSRDGGTRPFWAREGRLLLFTQETVIFELEVDLEANDTRGGEFRAGPPKKLLETDTFVGGSRNYDATVDLDRFVMVKQANDSRVELQLVLNWFTELERLVPTGR